MLSIEREHNGPVTFSLLFTETRRSVHLPAYGCSAPTGLLSRGHLLALHHQPVNEGNTVTLKSLALDTTYEVRWGNVLLHVNYEDEDFTLAIEGAPGTPVDFAALELAFEKAETLGFEVDHMNAEWIEPDLFVYPLSFDGFDDLDSDEERDAYYDLRMERGFAWEG